MSNATPDGVFGPGWNEVEADMASKAYLVTWLGAACASVIVYEYTITFGAEVEFYWWTKWTIPRVLFFLNRYLVGSIIIFDFIANAIPHLSVPFYLRWLSITVTITTSITEAILTTRVCALYRTHPRLRAFSILCCVLGTTTLVVITIVNYLATGPVDVVTDYPDLPGCQSTDNPFLAIAYWITPLCIESVFFIMVIYQAFGWVRQRQPPPPTLRLLARDSAVYFAW
ncbi:hypothetical protein BXZ70DRAFT_256982 [Cristinia sonorae]|uniref:DUF6533 domain-containing protein n=1 Tax=Cristinia sonorae TaxID=1940300 RepID=A0A8K0XU31_9AGAR|nr:hypothetical protein BXZ70DRAFT_256982 [Cristinia sonorae]